jgi:hypothetical protein
MVTAAVAVTPGSWGKMCAGGIHVWDVGALDRAGSRTQYKHNPTQPNRMNKSHSVATAKRVSRMAATKYRGQTRRKTTTAAVHMS